MNIKRGMIGQSKTFVTVYSKIYRRILDYMYMSNVTSQLHVHNGFCRCLMKLTFSARYCVFDV